MEREALNQAGTLYNYTYADQTPDFPLPFTYPPFAAVVFYPLTFLPFWLVSGRLAAGCRRGRSTVWCASVSAWLASTVAFGPRCSGPPCRIWLEPLRSTFDYGQINVALAFMSLCAVLQQADGGFRDCCSGPLRASSSLRRSVVCTSLVSGAGPRRFSR